ncbi:delta 9-fatty acid desaturase [Mycena floridula]|nr:delta 9-fatty acid desaturase [Mycena floridula]
MPLSSIVLGRPEKGPSASSSSPSFTPPCTTDSDNYVQHTVASSKPLPPVSFKTLHKDINYVSCSVIVFLPILSFIGACNTHLQTKTLVWSIAYYFATGLGITAGYHRLWAHRCYNAGTFLQYVLAFLGAGAVQGSIKWWSTGHRAHHRYTDTELDPYNAHEGFFHSHVGWIIFVPRRAPGAADISDLRKNPIVRWQHRHFVKLILLMSFAVPTLVAGLGWGDYKGGFIYAGLCRLLFVHHSTFCVNSLAHWLGESPFDDKHTPRDHVITALCTIGEGYHNFHHQFPMDYRNAIEWYQYDPTKWFIWSCEKLGLASHLKTFPANEVRKGQLTMQLKRLHETQERLIWPSESIDLPVVDWADFQEQSQSRSLILISGFIHDVTDFLSEHPGGAHLLRKYVGKDATTAFFGGVYEHSNAGHNLLAMKRVGVLHGGHPHVKDDKDKLQILSFYDRAAHENSTPPSQRLRIARFSELGGWSSGSGSSISSSYGLDSDD